MRSVLVLIAALAGCTGEQVLTPSVDSGADSPDTGTTDAGTCTKYQGNLTPEGDFATIGAWRASGCLLQQVAGPCNRALRMYDIKGPARINADHANAPLPKGKKFRLRAWFKRGNDAPPPTVPSVFVRSFFNLDGGEESKDYILNAPPLTGEWQLAESEYTLTEDQTGFQIFVDTYFAAGTTAHDFLVADVSFVPEP